MSEPSPYQRAYSDVAALRQGIRNRMYPDELGDNFRVSELLDTIEAMRAIVEQVAAPSVTITQHGAFRSCVLCRMEIDTERWPDWRDRFHHTPECPVTQARALLTKER